MFCIKCGKELPENCRYCPNCGNSVGSGAMGNEGNISTSPKCKKEKLLTNEFWIAVLTGISVSEFYYIVFYAVIRLYSSEISTTSLYLKYMTFVTVALLCSIKYGKSYIMDGIKRIRQCTQIRGIVGVSLGVMFVNWEILSSVGQSHDMKATLDKLLVESIFWIVLTAISAFAYKRKNTIKANMTALFYLAYAYNWLFWLMVLICGSCDGLISEGILSLFVLVILALPLVVALIAVICFYRCKRG